MNHAQSQTPAGPTPKRPADEPTVFHRVGEKLYRLATTGKYYGLIKRQGKQFRRSLKTCKTCDRELAERLRDMRQKDRQVGHLRRLDRANRAIGPLGR
jgi:hypothetical protein